MARKNKYTVDELLDIIEHFMLHKYDDEINGSLLERHAKNELCYKDIKYYHFTQREEVNAKIQEIQGLRAKKYASGEIQAFKTLNINEFLDKYYPNRLKLADALYQIQVGYTHMYDNMVRLNGENQKQKNRLNELENIDSKYSEEINILSKENRELKEKVKVLSNLIEVDNQIKMCRYVKEKAYIDGDLANQYLITLLKCGIITDEDAEKIISKTTTQETKPLNIISFTKDEVFSHISEEKLNTDDIRKQEFSSKDELDELLD